MKMLRIHGITENQTKKYAHEYIHIKYYNKKKKHYKVNLTNLSFDDFDYAEWTLGGLVNKNVK